jgi:hypothetical protein
VKEQFEAVLRNQGLAEADLYAARTLKIYRKCAQDRKHFAHIMPYRPHFVRSILWLRRYLGNRHG